MSKLLSATLLTAAVFLSQSDRLLSAEVGSCSTFCGPKPVEFIPGQRITVEVVNLTSNLVSIDKVQGTDTIPVSPGEVRSFVRGGSTEPNFSLVFLDINGLLLQVKVVKPERRTLRIELRPGGRIPGDRSVYLKDDGRVAVF